MVKARSSYLNLRVAWYYHVLFWLGIVVFWVLFVILIGDNVYEGFINKLCYLPSQILVTYLILLVLIPLLFRGQFIKAPFLLIAIAYMGTVLARILKIYVYETLLSVDDPKEGIIEILTQMTPLLGQYMIWVFMTPSIIILSILYFAYLRELEGLAELKKQKNTAELNFLKAQLHPHFLFNTLNNLYTLATQRSPITHVMVDKLYRMVDYMENNRTGVLGSTIIDEINIIRDYIALEQLRYGDRLNIDIEISITQETHPIPGLLFLSIVENSFKHGVSGDLDDPWIKISIVETNEVLVSTIANSKPQKVAKDEKDYKKGIGVNNVKRQLEITYPTSHNFIVEETDDSYTVRLKIQMNMKQQGINSLF